MKEENGMIPDNKGHFSEAVYDDNEVCRMCDTETLLFVKELLDEIQILRKEVIALRTLTNAYAVCEGEACRYPYPRSGLPGRGIRILENPLMRRYYELFGEYTLKY
jgi:hypothetical protein